MNIEGIVEEICYEGSKIGSPVPLEVYQAIVKALQSQADKYEKENGEMVREILTYVNQEDRSLFKLRFVTEDAIKGVAQKYGVDLSE